MIVSRIGRIAPAARRFHGASAPASDKSIISKLAANYPLAAMLTTVTGLFYYTAKWSARVDARTVEFNKTMDARRGEFAKTMAATMGEFDINIDASMGAITADVGTIRGNLSAMRGTLSAMRRNLEAIEAQLAILINRATPSPGAASASVTDTKDV